MLVVDAVKPEAPESLALKAWDGIGAAAAGRLLWKAVSKQAHWGIPGPQACPGQAFQGRWVVQRGQRDQFGEAAFHLRCDQRRRREPFASMDHSMTDRSSRCSGTRSPINQLSSTVSSTSSFDRLRPSCQTKPRWNPPGLL